MTEGRRPGVLSFLWGGYRDLMLIKDIGFLQGKVNSLEAFLAEIRSGRADLTAYGYYRAIPAARGRP